MKHLCLVIIGGLGLVACTPTSGLQRDAKAFETTTMAEQPRTSGTPSLEIGVQTQAALPTEKPENPNLQVADKRSYLETLCERGDHEAVRVHRASFKYSIEEPPLMRCWAEALLEAGRTREAVKVLTPILSRSDQEGRRSRQLLSFHYESFGRWRLIRDLYEGRELESDPDGLRSLGVAYHKLGLQNRLDELLPDRQPSSKDAWRWLWWLREFENNRMPEDKALAKLVKDLDVYSANYEVSALRVLATQAHRRGAWFVAAQRCVEEATREDNEILALTMSRTSISAALQGDLGLWEASLSCALALAQATKSPEATCQEIHLEQMDWQIQKKLSSEVKQYPSLGECGRENQRVRKWLDRWGQQGRLGASS